ncbi:MAG: hypothetical protein IJ007_03320 [Oscillospiraceae bacterium]|nr:hypothetical protein [Oscillospiraceae bacterium]
MKYIPFIALTAILCLTACTSQQVGEVQTETVIATASPTETTVTSLNERVLEISEAETATVTETTPETTVSLYEFNKHTEETRTYVEITAETPFYSCKYEQTGLCDGKDFTDTVLLEKAETALLSSQVYTDLYNEIKERMPDAEPALEISCSKVLAYDLDSNGSDEYAFLFTFSPDFDCTDEEMLLNVWGAINPSTPFGLVLCDSGGNFYTNDQKYAMDTELYVLNYGDFAQFVISGGVSNNSSCADFFSYYNGIFELELREFRAYGIQDNAFLVHTMAQASNAWLIFWNDDIKGYVTPEAVHVSREERDKIFEQLPLDNEQREQYKEYNICIIGNKYYSLYGGMLHSISFIKENGEFVPIEKIQWNDGVNERKMPLGREFEIPYAVNFDYDKAIDKIRNS